jgi:hypothetical protein
VNIDRCDGCRQSFNDVPRAPMLRDAAWRKLADPQAILCAGCMLERAIDRSVDLTLADLLPCPFNLFHAPRSWYHLFANGTPPSDEWRMAANELGIDL